MQKSRGRGLNARRSFPSKYIFILSHRQGYEASVFNLVSAKEKKTRRVEEQKENGRRCSRLSRMTWERNRACRIWGCNKVT